MLFVVVAGVLTYLDITPPAVKCVCGLVVDTTIIT